MKKIYYSIIITLITSFGAKAQSKFFPDTFAIWSEHSESLEDPNYQYQQRYDFLMQGDTQVNGKTYKVIYNTGFTRKVFEHGNIGGPYSVNLNHYFGIKYPTGGVRKDSGRLIYLPFPAGAEEEIAYDYNFQSGDTGIKVFDNFRKVLNDTVINGKREYFIEKLTPRAMGVDVIIEGMGSNRAILPIVPDFAAETVYVSFFCGDGILYTGDQFGSGVWTATETSECKKDLSAFLATEKVAQDNVVSVYPNPTIGTLFIDDLSENSTLTLTDITGKTVTTIEGTDAKVSLNLTELSKGIYVLRITNGTSISTSKIVKE